LGSGALSDDTAVLQIAARDQIDLVPRVRRFLNAYLDADASRREDFRKATAYASCRLDFDSSTTPSLTDDIATALIAAQEAADIAFGTDDESLDGTGATDSDLLILADAFATIAFAYRYVVGSYATDVTLDELGEVAVAFVLLVEREHDSAIGVGTITAPTESLMTSDADRANQDFESSLFFVPATVGQNHKGMSSTQVVSPRAKRPVLMTV
jgi:hypothetical protein